MLRKFLLGCILAMSTLQTTDACTGIIREAGNGDWVYARTMEFGPQLLSFELLFVPRGIAYTAHAPNGQSGATWTTKYAHVGFNPTGMTILIDGLNEKGLACGGFYFPGWAEYEKVPSQDFSKAISNLDFVSWVLGNFTTVAEVRQALKEIKVTGAVLDQWGIVPGEHYMVVDATGDRAVVEYIGGELKIYAAPLGVMTNTPSYDWHETNARNYIGLRALNQPSVTINGKELSAFGQGSGALGLPGDFTSPSRFIRAGFLRDVVLPGKDGLDEIKVTFKILNQFDIPLGSVRDKQEGKEVFEETQWTSASDLTGRRYFFHTYESRVIRSVDLKTLDVNAKELKTIDINGPETIVDVSKDFLSSKKT